jgi:pimeloyl-ACP methyl ester carboxylesterase
VLLFPGTWLSGLADLAEAPRQAEVRLLYVDRPGYGRSDGHAERTLLTWADDVDAFADAMGFDAFAVVGCSGGGPYALACAAASPSRVLATAVVSAVGPAQDMPDVAAAITPARQAQVELARRDACAARAAVIAEATAGVEGIADDPSPAPDVEQPGIRRRIEAALRETAARGPDGPATDLRLNYLEPWGFDLAAIQGPVWVWHAEDDETVPIGVGRAVADRLPNAIARFTRSGGHMLLWLRAEDILGELRDRLLQLPE